MDSEPAEVYEAYNPDIEITADIVRTVERLAEWADSAEIAFDIDWYPGLRKHIYMDVSQESVGDPPYTVREILSLLREAMAPEDVLLSDVGSHKMAIAQNFPTCEPNTCIISNRLASMGIAVPGGLAADLAIDTNVVAATGDGGFLMNAAEIETGTRIGCEYTIVVFTDNDYGLISEKQQTHTGESFGTELTNPDFMTFADSFGVEGYRPESVPEIREAFDEAMDDTMGLIEISVR